MGGRAVTPGAALLRSSRMFSMPRPLPMPPTADSLLGDQKTSDTMTKSQPRLQAITSPLSSRQKGDWGVKRSLPLKTTLATSTPFVRINQIDAIENITDFHSAADHVLSLEKFQELRIPLAIPSRPKDSQVSTPTNKEDNFRSVFEEDSDFTDLADGTADLRWKFKGPWLAQMADGEFLTYLAKKVRPQRAQFRAILRKKLAESMTTNQNRVAVEAGKPTPAPVTAADITDEQFSEYVRELRQDRVTLYALISKFLDLPPLGIPIGVAQYIDGNADSERVAESPYGKSGPPPSHPSAGISYLRTGAFLENHAVYGPQANKTPVLARIVSPKIGSSSAKLGVGGFVASVPTGANDFNAMSNPKYKKQLVRGINGLDISTYGGAKAYIEPHTATVDPEGKVVIKVRETSAEAQVIAKELKGQAKIYNDSALKRHLPEPEQPNRGEALQYSRANQVYDEMLSEDQVSEGGAHEGHDLLSNSSSYGLDSEPPSETR